MKTVSKGKALSLMTMCMLVVCVAVGFSSSPSPNAAGEISPSSMKGWQTFEDAPYAITFQYPEMWTLKEVSGRTPQGPQFALHKIRIEGDRGEMLNILIFKKNRNLKKWIKENRSEYALDQPKLVQAKAIVSGCSGYSWRNIQYGTPVGGTIVFNGDQFMYELNFKVDYSMDVIAVNKIIDSLSVGSGGETCLSFDPLEVDWAGGMEQLRVANCCNLTDSGTNRYPCPCDSAPNTGNCTWYCEYRASGSNNFDFDGQGGHGYMWLEHAWNTGDYPVAGTIPEVGAIMVFKCSWGSYGHVAWVTSVNNDGTITVDEQNWCGTCTQSRTYTTTQLRNNLAGYIYRDGSRPGPADKTVYGFYTGQITTIDDFNFNSTYNFQAYGPGHTQTCTLGNHRGWSRGGGDGHGYNSWYHYTQTQTGSTTNYGKWNVNIYSAGYYEIQAFIPGNNATATRARYRVYHYQSGGYHLSVYSDPVNQNNEYDAWVKVSNPNRADGYWYFTNSSLPYVQLEDNYGGNNPESGRLLGFDAIRFIKR